MTARDTATAPVVDSPRCEGLPCPLGVDEAQPRFTWVPGCVQAAYRVTVAGSAEPTWDSGWVASAEPAARYPGPALAPRTRYAWSVRIRDDAGRDSPTAASSWFETGLFPASAWPSEWIRSPVPDRGRAEIFLRTIDLPAAPLRARAYVAGLGYFELRANGAKAGDSVLDPAWTDFHRSIRYVVLDLTSLLVPGRNTLAVMVAAGRSREPLLNLRFFAVLADGSQVEDGTDHRTWRWSPQTPVTETDIYHGETFDARIVVPGWDGGTPIVAAAIDPTLQPLTAEPPGGELRAQEIEPIRVVADLAPIAVRDLASVTGGEPSATVYDLGQNFAGWVRIRVEGQRGSAVQLRYSEALRDDGRVEPKMNRGARASDRYVLCGGGAEEWEPRFTYHGFRYVQVEAEGQLDGVSLVGRVVRSSVEKIGSFRCADEIANRIRAACEWTEGSNLHSLPTDCPQREERLGWLNDMTVRAEPALYTFGLGLLYAKWAEDIAHTQGPSTGAIADVAPFDAYRTPPFGSRPADPVCSSYLLVPWLVYLHTADARPLERRYPGLVRWYEYLLGQADDGILGHSSWGDWASPQAFSVEGSIGGGAVSAVTPGALVSSAFLYYDAYLLAKIAAAIGRPADADRFAREAEQIARAFNDRFHDGEARCYGTGSQACQAIPLALGVVPTERIDGAVACLVRDIVQANDTHLSTGNLASRYVLEVLCDHGQVDLAWTLATRSTCPGWGYMIGHGATTIWERWEYIRGGAMSSHNHPMYATVSGWFSKYLCGIRASEAAPGFALTVVRPHVPSTLAWAEAGLETVRGTVRASWKRLPDGAVEYAVRVPPSGRARLELPPPTGADPASPRVCSTVGGGSHTIVLRRE